MSHLLSNKEMLHKHSRSFRSENESGKEKEAVVTPPSTSREKTNDPPSAPAASVPPSKSLAFAPKTQPPRPALSQLVSSRMKTEKSWRERQEKEPASKPEMNYSLGQSASVAAASAAAAAAAVTAGIEQPEPYDVHPGAVHVGGIAEG